MIGGRISDLRGSNSFYIATARCNEEILAAASDTL